MRIGIVGAGAAGLAAAEYLQEKGYENVTLLERNNFVGGKCHTIEHEGLHYEVGAGISVQSSEIILGFAKKYGVEVVRASHLGDVFVDSDSGELLERPSILKKAMLMGKALMKYGKLNRQYRSAEGAGLWDLAPELCEPFTVWAKKNGLEALVEEFAFYFTGFGYGYLDQIPTAYVFKYYAWSAVRAFMKKDIYQFPGGIQHLWTAVAKAHDVRYGKEVQQVSRTNGVIKVVCADEEFEFDRLILAGPLDEALQYLDANDEEKELFSKVQFVDYRTYVLRLKNFTKLDGYFPGNLNASRQGHPVFWYHQHPESELYTFYVMADFKISDEEVQENLREIIGKMGGEVQDVHDVFHWKYFPHVSPEEMAAGYYDRLEARQGKGGLYFTGEFLNFSTVGHSAQYSQSLVERFF